MNKRRKEGDVVYYFTSVSIIPEFLNIKGKIKRCVVHSSNNGSLYEVEGRGGIVSTLSNRELFDSPEPAIKLAKKRIQRWTMSLESLKEDLANFERREVKDEQ